MNNLFKTKFFRWLKQKNEYENFCFYFVDWSNKHSGFHRWENNKLTKKQFFDIIPSSLYLLYAFRWADTKQGEEYYRKLNVEWDNFLK